eukprot:Rmarinus@m.11886
MPRGSVGSCTNRLDDGEIANVPACLGSFLEEMRCKICSYIGVSWETLPCDHIFCKDCVDSLLTSKPAKCPLCRTEFIDERVKPSRDRNSISSTLPVLCTSVGRANGCDWNGDYDLRQGHVSLCEYQPIRCLNAGCEAQVMRKCLDAHSSECDFRSVACSYSGCTEKFLFHQKRERESHTGTCGKKPISCDACNETVCAGDLQDHVENHCPQCSVTCAAECKRQWIDKTSQTPKNEESAPDNEESSNDAFNGAFLNEAVSPLADMCVWKGKRCRLSQHRVMCMPYNVSSFLHRFREKIVEDLNEQRASLDELRRDISNERCSYAWDVRYVDRTRYKPDEKIVSPTFFLRGRKWCMVLLPKGQTGGEEDKSVLFVYLLDRRECESFETKFRVHCGGHTLHNKGFVYSDECSAWGRFFSAAPDSNVQRNSVQSRNDTTRVRGKLESMRTSHLCVLVCRFVLKLLT